jgi:diacylglycerol kinase (ATP)
MRVQLMTNPESGGGTQEDEVRRALERHGARCGDEDPERIVVAGGDGTLAGAAARAAELNVPLAVIPTGTANDFARAWGLPEDIDEAAALAVTGAPDQAHDLAFMDDRPFVNLAAAGLHPAAARRAAPLKRSARWPTRSAACSPACSTIRSRPPSRPISTASPGR